MEPVGMTNASATNVFSINTSTTTKTTVSQISRRTSRGSSLPFTLVLPLGDTAGAAALPLPSPRGLAVGRAAASLSWAMRHLFSQCGRIKPYRQNAYYVEYADSKPLMYQTTPAARRAGTFVSAPNAPGASRDSARPSAPR